MDPEPADEAQTCTILPTSAPLVLFSESFFFFGLLLLFFASPFAVLAASFFSSSFFSTMPEKSFRLSAVSCVSSSSARPRSVACLSHRWMPSMLSAHGLTLDAHARDGAHLPQPTSLNDLVRGEYVKLLAQTLHADAKNESKAYT